MLNPTLQIVKEDYRGEVFPQDPGTQNQGRTLAHLCLQIQPLPYSAFPRNPSLRAFPHKLTPCIYGHCNEPILVPNSSHS